MDREVVLSSVCSLFLGLRITAASLNPSCPSGITQNSLFSDALVNSCISQISENAALSLGTVPSVTVSVQLSLLTALCKGQLRAHHLHSLAPAGR